MNNAICNMCLDDLLEAVRALKARGCTEQAAIESVAFVDGIPQEEYLERVRDLKTILGVSSHLDLGHLLS